MLDVYSQRRQEVAAQVKALIAVRGPRTAAHKLQLEALLNEADDLEHGISLEHQRRQTEAFALWLRGGRAFMSPEQYRLLKETRDMSELGLGTGAAAGSGIFVPVEIARQITSAMKDYSDVLALANLVDAKNGRANPFPLDNDASISGEGPVSEAQQVAAHDVASPGQVILGAYKFTSRIILVSNELFTDSAELDFPGYFARIAASRLARVISQFATVGTGAGNSQPCGFMNSTTIVIAGTAVGANVNDGVSGANSLGTADFAALESAVDVAYRKNAVWMAHPSTLQKLRAQLDREGRPLFPGLQNSPDGLDRVFNRRLYANPFMDALQAEPSSPPVTNRPLALVDFSRFTIRRMPMVVWVLRERWAERDSTGLLAVQRADCNFTDSGACAAYTQTTY